MDGVKSILFAFILIVFIKFCCATRSEAEQPHILGVSCNRSGLIIEVFLESGFSGAVYAQGNYFSPPCKYDIKEPKSMNLTVFHFIPIEDCGTMIQEFNGDVLASNVIIVQKYQFVETAWDAIYNVSCKIPALDVSNSTENQENETAVYQFDKLYSWMEFRLDMNVFSSKEALKLRVGDEFSLVVHLKDGGQNEDVQVQTCWAYDGESMDKSKYVISIYDFSKCQPSDWVSDFTLEKGTGNDSNIMFHATLKAFKFPTTVKVHFTCSIRVCQETCQNYCGIQENERSNHVISRKKIKRSSPERYSDKSFSERYRLMKATIKALRAKLLQRNRTLRSENDSNFRRRISDSSSTALPENDGGVILIKTHQEEWDTATRTKFESSTNSSYYDTTEFEWNSIYLFNITNKIEVLTAHEFNFRYNVLGSSHVSKCVSQLKFSLIISTMCFIVLCLILSIAALLLYLRKEKKKHSIDNFLLYSFN